jgi:hypothetical protein
MEIESGVAAVGWLVACLIVGGVGAVLGMVVVRRNRRTSRLL